ncbi:MAG: hypothetical protein GX442_00185 [Candidatus Riflebacteria bacterium]|nr:hypothetical protein [Candidatus Riflebacteria bacterium]
MNTWLGTLLTPFLPLLLLCGALLAGADPKSGKIELSGEEHSARIIHEFQDDTGFPVPSGAVGLTYAYFPPIDPIVFARFAVNDEGKREIIKRAGEVEACPDFPKGFADARCPWWSIATETTVFSKTGRYREGYMEIHIVQEGSRCLVYIKHFTL